VSRQPRCGCLTSWAGIELFFSSETPWASKGLYNGGIPKGPPPLERNKGAPFFRAPTLRGKGKTPPRPPEGEIRTPKKRGSPKKRRDPKMGKIPPEPHKGTPKYKPRKKFGGKIPNPIKKGV